MSAKPPKRSSFAAILASSLVFWPAGPAASEPAAADDAVCEPDQTGGLRCCNRAFPDRCFQALEPGDHAPFAGQLFSTEAAIRYMQAAEAHEGLLAAERLKWTETASANQAAAIRIVKATIRAEEVAPAEARAKIAEAELADRPNPVTWLLVGAGAALLAVAATAAAIVAAARVGSGGT